MKSEQTKISALLNLLEDEDSQVSTLAMEQLLLLERGADDLLQEFQEAANPRLRGRIHQLGSILKIRRSRNAFIHEALNSTLSLWAGLLHINYQYNPRLNFESVDGMLNELAARLPAKLTTVRLCAFLRDENFQYTQEDTLGSDLFLVEDVLVQRVGSPILLSVIAHCLGEKAGWHSSPVLYHGRHCLIDDSHGNLIEPADGWKITRYSRDDRLHPCGDRDIWLTVLCQLFLAAMLEGRLQAIHRVGAILARLCGAGTGSLPYPLGGQVS